MSFAAALSFAAATRLRVVDLELVVVVVTVVSVDCVVEDVPPDVVVGVDLRILACSFIFAFISFSTASELRRKYSKTPFSMAQRKKFSLPTVVRKTG